MAGIDVISTSLVAMAGDGNSGNTISMSRLQLSPFDLRLLLIGPIQRGILFLKPPQSHQTLIPHLKSSLSHALDFFPPLAGRLAATAKDEGTTTFHVDCNNAGVDFIHATAAAVTVSDITQPKYIPQIVPSFLFPLNGNFPNCEGVSKPLIGIQVTELADGVFIACSANHAVVDGVSFWHFINSWSEISRGSDKISRYPVFERSFPADVGLPPLDMSLWRSFAPPPLLERFFHFSKESVAKLKARANAEVGTDKISSLQALSAHLWRSSLRCRRNLGMTDHLRGGEVGFMIAASARARVPLPEGYFGNAAYGARTYINEVEVLEKGLGYAALKINEFVAARTKGAMEKFVKDWTENPKVHGKGSYVFFIASSHRHNVYGNNDFGWGKPIAVRSGEAQKFDGRVAVFPAVDGGIDAEVCLAPEVLQAMEADAEFMEVFTI